MKRERIPPVVLYNIVQKLYLYIKPANMQKYLGEQLGKIDREIKRAEVIKQILEDKR